MDIHALSRFYSEVKNSDVQFAVVEIQKKPHQEMVNLTVRYGLDFPMLMVDEGTPNSSYSTSGRGLHTSTFVIDPNRKVVASFDGYMKYYIDDLRKAISAMR
jgi:peroxiredoxin